MDSFFDKLGDTIVTGGKAVGDKARELSDTAKLQIELKRNEDIVMEEYAKLGKKYYEAHKDEDPAEFATLEAALRQVAHVKQQISDVKGEKICPKCGAANAADAAFCSKCGEKLD